MSRRRGRCVRAKEKMPPSKIQQLSRKLRSSKKIQPRKKKLLFKGNKQKPTTKKLKKIKIEEDSETLETNDVQVPDNKEVLPIFEEPGEPEVEQKEEETVSEEKKPVISEEINAIIQSEETEELDMQPKSDEENLQEISKNCAEENMEIDIPPVDEQSKISEENTVEIDSGIEGMSPEKDAENNVTSLHNVCSVCNVVTDSSASLTLHMKQHSLTNNQTHQCLICKKSLSSASSLDRHMLVHSGERPFKCKVCDMSFTTNGNMHRHMRTHGEFDTSNFPLSLDLRKKDTQVEDSENVSKSLEEKLHCPVCGKAFLCKYGLQTHMETHPNDPILCQKCKTISVNYTAHVEHKCNIQNSDTPAFGFHDLTFMDFTANKFSLVSKSYCEQNVKRPSSAFHIFECSECKKAFPCGRALKMHQQVHESKIGTFCPSCRCDFAATPFLQVHQLKHRSAEHCLHHDSNQSESQKADKQLPHASKEDFLALLNLQTKQSHLAVLKSMNTVQVKEDDYENMDYFIHGKGGKKNQKGDSDGNNNNDFADIQSIISLTSKAPLIPVAQSSPVAVRPASPYVATKQPKSPQIAESANASPETPSKEEILSSHDNQDVPDVDSTDIPGVYSCNICSQQFKNIGTLKRHCKLHVQRGSNYSCHLCSYVSVDKSTLIRHLRTHNGERPFQCVICKYAFTTKANCERHVRKRHKKFGKAEIRNSMQYNPNMSLRGSDPTSSEIGNTETVCKYCGVDFKFNRVLRHHLRSLHNSCNRKPFSCKICKFGFSTKNNCIRHVLKQHPNLKDKLRSVVIPNSMMPQIRNTEEKTHSEISSSSPSQTVGEQSQPLDLHCETSEKPLNLQTEKSAQEFANEAVIAAEGLVSLSEALPLQDEPLDLAVHPLDLTCKPLAAVTKKYDPKPSSIFCTSPNSNSKPIGSVDLTTAKSLPAPENRLQIERLPSHMQVERLPCVNNLKQIENTSQNEISFTSPGQKMRAFTCIYCKAGFTLKSNMERHIKRKHPEFARPTRSRNYIPSIVTPNLQKQNPTTTLSDKTRDALRHVLNNKVQQVPVYKAFNTESFSKIGGTFKIVSTANNFIAQSNNTVLSPAVNVSLDLSGKTRNVTIVDINPTNLKLPENNEENCSDLASVSSVICTANSPQFKQYLEKPAEIEKMDISQKESKKTDETVNIKKNDMPSVSCPFCDRKFPWTSSLRRHILTHTGQKPFKCPKCSLWFTTKSNCERHLIRKHGHKGDLITRSVPDRPYKCNHCLTSTFSTQGNLRKHFYLKHWTKSYLGMNCKTVQPENSPTSPVENKSELSISAVTSQEHSYSQIERKLPHSCHFCDKSFENIIGLSSHMFEHNNVVYKCYLCKKTFPSHDICFSHFKTSHSLVYTQVIQNDKVWFNFTEDFCKDLPEVSSADSDAYLIACMVCFQKMSSIESLQQHFKKHLAKDKPSDDQDFAVSKDSPNKVIQSPSKVVPSPSKEDSVNLEHSQPNALAQSKKLRATKNKVKNSLLYFFTPNSNCNSSIKSIKTTNSKLDASQDDESDLIQNLLGIHDSKMIDEMLVSADSAARLLGVEEV